MSAKLAARAASGQLASTSAPLDLPETRIISKDGKTQHLPRRHERAVATFSKFAPGSRAAKRAAAAAAPPSLLPPMLVPFRTVLVAAVVAWRVLSFVRRVWWRRSPPADGDAADGESAEAPVTGMVRIRAALLPSGPPASLRAAPAIDATSAERQAPSLCPTPCLSLAPFLPSTPAQQRLMPTMLRNALPKKKRQGRPQQLAQQQRVVRGRNARATLQQPRQRPVGVLAKWDAALRAQERQMAAQQPPPPLQPPLQQQPV
jgi:hypothetical protein